MLKRLGDLLVTQRPRTWPGCLTCCGFLSQVCAPGPSLSMSPAWRILQTCLQGASTSCWSALALDASITCLWSAPWTGTRPSRRGSRGSRVANLSRGRRPLAGGKPHRQPASVALLRAPKCAPATRPSQSGSPSRRPSRAARLWFSRKGLTPGPQPRTCCFLLMCG